MGRPTRQLFSCAFSFAFCVLAGTFFGSTYTFQQQGHTRKAVQEYNILLAVDLTMTRDFLESLVL